MDLRILKEDGSIDWAMAGERVVTSKDPLKVLFTKSLDSHSSSTSTDPSPPDEGEFTTLPNGDSLETGSMPNPARNNEMTPYEEVWRVLSPRSGGEVAYILESCDDDGKGVGEVGRKTFIGRIGGQLLVLTEKRDEGENGITHVTYAARREEWDETRWTSKCQIGAFSSGIPSFVKMNLGIAGFEGEENWKTGDVIELVGKKYMVRGYEKLVDGQ